MNLLSTLLTAALLTTALAVAETQPVTVTVTDDGKGPELAPLAALHTADFTDPFTAYLDGKAPEILSEVAFTNTTPENITVRRVVFRSRDDSEIFALIATPKTPGKHPGMLVLHGGGGSAAVDQAMAWAQHGYVAVAPDMPGIADPKKLAATKGKWSAVKYGENRWLAVKHPRGVVAELKSKNDRTAVLSSEALAKLPVTIA